MYCTQQDLVDRFGQDEIDSFATDENDQVVQEKIDQAIADAGQTIDLYIAARVQLPIAQEDIPAVLVTLAADIARYRLQDDNPLDEARKRYEDAIKTLKDIAQGKASIGPATQPQKAANVDALRGDSDRVFSRETLAGY